MIKDRYLSPFITSDLQKKMVFLGGPRQVGKTSLALFIGRNHYKNSTYYNWDNRDDKKAMLHDTFPSETDLIIFDEIHKYRPWKNFIKGKYDKHKDDFHMLVTGSARLDLYRKGGDSLMGRYHYYRLHPFTLAEVLKVLPKSNVGGELFFVPESANAKTFFNRLFQFGGFPEPYLEQDIKTLRRFHNERFDRLFKEDIREIESIRYLSQLQIFAELLPTKVGSLLSLNSFREDLQVTHKTISHWADVLENFYYHFRIYPFASSLIKSLRKEPKLYLWDWSQIHDESIRLENMVASHLLKFVHFIQDTQGYKIALHFLRDVEQREVDFLVTINNSPWFAVEVKKFDTSPSSTLLYFQKKLRIPFIYQVIMNHGIDQRQTGIRVISASKFLTSLI
ncbi:MAG: ATP-binding protein [Parcubacteria group bacterium]|nr:ATP-binding protein [Parcubacteria group bacterium]